MDWNQCNELVETLKAILEVLKKIADPKADKPATKK